MSSLRFSALLGRALQAARLAQGAPQEELDLPVQAPQIIVGPSLQGRERGRIDA